MTFFQTGLPSRGLISIRGSERAAFLQRLITNDIHQLDTQPLLYSLLLNSQGRVLHDFFITNHQDHLLIDVRQTALSSLLNRLTLYKLNADVQLDDISDTHQIMVAPHGHLLEREIPWRQDPRHPNLGMRAIVSKAVQSETQESSYRDFLLKQGIPEQGYGLESGKTIPLEAGLQDLNALSWTKGCYVGQELIARTYHRGEIRKRFFPITSSQALDNLPLSVITAQGEAAGEIVYAQQTHAIARLRLAFLDQPLNINDTQITVGRPEWMIFE